MASLIVSASLGSEDVAEEGTDGGKSSDLRASQTGSEYCITALAP